MTNYKINSRDVMTFDFAQYVIVSATFARVSGDLTVVEIYRVEEGLEMFVGYLRGDCSEDLKVKGAVARAALDLLVFEEMARAA